jgi:hypothetical protein
MMRESAMPAAHFRVTRSWRAFIAELDERGLFKAGPVLR